MTPLRLLDWASARSRFTLWLLSFLGSLAVLVSTLPSRGPLGSGIWVGRDSGVFLYSGWRVLQGDVPYHDFWDHKWPLIFYIDAAGLFLGRGSVWGVFILEVVAVSCAVALCFLVVRHDWGTVAATTATVAMLCGLGLVVEYGNLTEEYSLPFTMLTFYVFVRALAPQALAAPPTHPHIMFYLVGCVGTMPVLLKPNLGGALAAIGVFLGWGLLFGPHRRAYAFYLASVLTGVMTMITAVTAYFWHEGALDSFVDAAIEFNLFHASASMLDRAKAAVNGLVVLSPSMLPQMAIAGWIITAFANHRLVQYQRSPLAQVAFIAFPLEIVLASTSGYAWPHYFMALLPTAAILSGVAVHWFQGRSDPSIISETNRARVYVLLAVLVSFSLLVNGLGRGVSLVHFARGNDIASVAVECLQRDAIPSGTVLIWGADSSVNFHTRRESPTRFVYQAAVFHGNSRMENASELEETLEHSSPIFIIDARHDSMPSLDPVGRQGWLEAHPDQVGATPIPGEELAWAAPYAALWDLIDTNYKRGATLERGGVEWVIYEHVEDPDIRGSWQAACSDL